MNKLTSPVSKEDGEQFAIFMANLRSDVLNEKGREYTSLSWSRKVLLL